jgi:hypothetical protein
LFSQKQAFPLLGLREAASRQHWLSLHFSETKTATGVLLNQHFFSAACSLRENLFAQEL